MILTDFREQISSVVNNAQLPVDAVYFIMKDVMAEIESLYFEECQRERAIAMQEQMKQQQEKEKTEETQEEENKE